MKFPRLHKEVQVGSYVRNVMNAQRIMFVYKILGPTVYLKSAGQFIGGKFIPATHPRKLRGVRSYCYTEKCSVRDQVDCNGWVYAHVSKEA